MFKRNDGLGPVLLPFDLVALVLAALCVLWRGTAGWAIVPAFIGWWALCLAVLLLLFFFVTWCISLTVDMDREPPKEDHPHYRFIVHYVIALLCRFGRVRIHCTGEGLLPEGRFLIVSNHRSGYDPITTVWALRKRGVAFVTKPEIFHIPMAGPLIYRANFLPIDREDPRRAMRTIYNASDLLKNDVVSVGVYPEGTRGHASELLPFHNGVFKIAQRAGTPLVVASIRGTDRILKNTPWRHTDVYLRILTVIPPEELTGSTRDVSARVRAVIQEDLDGGSALETAGRGRSLT